jgi:hypothetical protein
MAASAGMPRRVRGKALPMREISGKIEQPGRSAGASMRAMSIVVAISFLTLVAFAELAHADGTWCAFYGTGFSGRNCGFYSFEQCRASVSGIGGFCQPNNWTNPGEPRRRYPAR